jgi:pyruvate kinase
VEAVRFISEIARSAEEYFLERVQGPYRPKKEKNPAKYLAYAAALLADNLESPAIVCHSTSGSTARLLSSRRPSQAIYALTPKENVLRHMNFFWGVRPRPSDGEIVSHIQRLEKFIGQSHEFTADLPLVITCGEPTPGEKQPVTNTIQVYYK